MDVFLQIVLAAVGLGLAWQVVRFMVKTAWWIVTSIVGFGWAAAEAEIFNAVLFMLG